MGGESQMHGTDRAGARTRRGALIAILVVVAVCAAVIALAVDTRGTVFPPAALWIVTVLAVLIAFPLLLLRRGGPRP